MSFTWNVDPVLLPLWGGLGLRYYGLLFALVFIGGYLLFAWQVTRAGGSQDEASALLLPGALATVIGARLGHVLFYQPDRLLADPLWVLQVWQGGLASHGALVGLLIGLYWYARHYRQSYLECLDRCTFSAALGSILVRIGNFFNSEIVGKVTDGTWGVRLPRYDQLPPNLAPLRHPSQLYEAGLGILIMGLLFWADRRLGREERPRGVMTGIFLTAYFTGRFCVEFFKEFQVAPESDFPLTMGQVLSIPAVIGGVILLWISWRRKIPAGWQTAPAKAGKKK